MTGSGITLYMLYLGSYTLAAMTIGVFAPLIIFHFAIDRLPKSNVEWRQQQKVTRRIKLHT